MCIKTAGVVFSQVKPSACKSSLLTVDNGSLIYIKQMCRLSGVRTAPYNVLERVSGSWPSPSKT